MPALTRLGNLFVTNFKNMLHTFFIRSFAYFAFYECKNLLSVWNIPCLNFIPDFYRRKHCNSCFACTTKICCYIDSLNFYFRVLLLDISQNFCNIHTSWANYRFK